MAVLPGIFPGEDLVKGTAVEVFLLQRFLLVGGMEAGVKLCEEELVQGEELSVLPVKAADIGEDS